MTSPKILKASWPYFQKFLTYHGLEITPTYRDPSIWGGDQVKISGYSEYNFLLDINYCLSSRPSGLVRDRTETVRLPFLTQHAGSWVIPDQAPDLSTCFFNRVKCIESRHSIVNLMWSGGIDSTAMVVAWLKFANSDTKIRILYSLDSIKENLEFFLHLQTQTRIDLKEIGGNVFYKNDLDGVEINGGAGDDITASIDQSFYDNVEWRGLQSPWRDFFWKKNPDQKFMDFCEKWFSLSGLEIDTVLAARWWFYINKMSPSGSSRIVRKSYTMSESFFADSLFTAHFYHNIDSLIASPSWKTYKQSIKNFIYDYYPDSEYRDNKCKENSGGATIFSWKSALLNQEEEICCLSDGTSICTDNLPFLSQVEYRNKYGKQLDYLFNYDV
jgi:hypothetical protein